MQRSKSRANSDILHLGCGEDYHEDAWNVDAEPSVDPDELYNLDELPWPWPDNSFDTIRAFHVFEHLDNMELALRESKRVLRPAGHLMLKLPMGSDAKADPDHSWGGRQPWTWRTPEMYCGKRHWDIDVGLEVYQRDCELWSLAAAPAKNAFQRSIWRWRYERWGPGEWCFEMSPMSGEFTVIFRNPEQNHE